MLTSYNNSEQSLQPVFLIGQSFQGLGGSCYVRCSYRPSPAAATLLGHQTTCSSTNTCSFNFVKSLDIFGIALGIHVRNHFRCVDNVETETICSRSKFVLYNFAETFICYNFQSPYLAAK